MSIANLLWRHKEHRFVMFVYGTAIGIIFHTNVGVPFFVFFSFQAQLERVLLFEMFSFQNDWVRL